HHAFGRGQVEGRLVLRRRARPPAATRRAADVADLERDAASSKSTSRSNLSVSHDLFRKPVSTFRDHALVGTRRARLAQARPRRGRPDAPGSTANLPTGHAGRGMPAPFAAVVNTVTRRAGGTRREREGWT